MKQRLEALKGELVEVSNRIPQDTGYDKLKSAIVEVDALIELAPDESEEVVGGAVVAPVARVAAKKGARK